MRDGLLLDVEHLTVSFPVGGLQLRAVDDVSLSLAPGHCLCVVGESGCGKSAMARSLLRLHLNADVGGRILFRETPEAPPVDVASIDPGSAAMRRIRGAGMGMVFQEPMASLTPVYSVGRQIVEAILAHEDVARVAAWERAVECLGLVGIPDPERRANDFPHQMSGGMRQRVVIAMALACRPALLIADEPTTALDVTVQSQVLRLMKSIQVELGMAILLVTHDLSVVAAVADEVVVMYLGQIVERAPAREFFAGPRHPYAQGLLASVVPPNSSAKLPLPFISGQVPNALASVTGCPFAPRCPQVHERCATRPPMTKVGGVHEVACWLVEAEAAN